ncbi:unnamed protein product [Prunus brigantina]
MRVMKSELALAQIVVFGVLHMFGRREEFKRWFPFLNASIFMIVLENQELGMTRGRIVDFEMVNKMDEMDRNSYPGIVDTLADPDVGTNMEELRNSASLSHTNCADKSSDKVGKSSTELSSTTMGSWFEMISGAKNIMEKYSVKTCGYCLEVQVGPKGHKVRMCKASKHQSRNGLHAWQEATIEDLVGLNYVWHVRDVNCPALDNNLKRYYGKAPAVVELCVQAGAPVPDEYRSMMRSDVASPERDEVDLVA